MIFLLLYSIFINLSSEASISETKKYSIYTENLKFLSYQDPGEKKIKGIATEIVDKIFKISKIKYSMKVLPWARAYKSVLKDKNGFIFTLLKNKKRKDLFQWIGPILVCSRGLWTLENNKHISPVLSLKSLTNYKIGVTRSESIHQMLLNIGFEEDKNIFPVTQTSQNIKKLIRKRIDIVPGNIYTIDAKLSDAGYPHEKLKNILSIEGGLYYIGVNKSVPLPVVKKLKESLQQLKTTSFIKDIHKKYNIKYNHELYHKHFFDLK